MPVKSLQINEVTSRCLVLVDLECETAVISLLLISFDLLRAQMGSELIQTILQSTFAAFNMFVNTSIVDNVRMILL